MLKITEQNRKWWVLIAVAASLATLYVDMTGVAVALPQIHRDFGISIVMQQWVINAYLLAIAILVIIGGKLSDIFSRKRVFLVGVSGFAFASFLCGIAVNGKILILSRILQGMFGAALIPNTAVTILNVFPAEEHGKAIGTYVGLGSIFLALGPFLGGFFTEFVSWRMVFLINVPLDLLSIVLIVICIAEEKLVVSEKRDLKKEIDWFGFLLFGISMACLVVAIMQGGEWGWSSKIIINLFVAAVISFVLFLFIEKYTDNPLIDFKIFKNKLYSVGVIIGFCLQISIMSRIFIPLYLQLDLRYSAFVAGLLIMPAASLNIFLAPLAGRMLDKNGARSTMLIGLWMLLVGFLFLGIAVLFHSYLKILPWLILTGAGMPFAFMCVSVTVLAQATAEQKGMAAGIYMQVRQLSNTIGMAIIAAIINNFSNHLFVSAMKSNNLAQQLQEVKPEALLTGSDFTRNITATLSPHVVKNIYNIAINAYSKAFSFGMLSISLLILVALVLAIKKFKL